MPGKGPGQPDPVSNRAVAINRYLGRLEAVFAAGFGASTRRWIPGLEGMKAEGLVGKVRKEMGLSRREFSRLIGYSERAIVNWESGRTPDEPALRRIREI